MSGAHLGICICSPRTPDFRAFQAPLFKLNARSRTGCTSMRQLVGYRERERPGESEICQRSLPQKCYESVQEHAHKKKTQKPNFSVSDGPRSPPHEESHKKCSRKCSKDSVNENVTLWFTYALCVSVFTYALFFGQRCCRKAATKLKDRSLETSPRP